MAAFLITLVWRLLFFTDQQQNPFLTSLGGLGLLATALMTIISLSLILCRVGHVKLERSSAVDVGPWWWSGEKQSWLMIQRSLVQFLLLTIFFIRTCSSLICSVSVPPE